MIHRLLAGAVVTVALAATPCWAKPIVFWASEPVGPDETVILTGADLGGIRRVRVRLLGNDPDGSPAASASVEADISQAGESAIGFVVPSRLAAGVYGYELEEEDGARTAGTLNAPDLFWSQGDAGVAATPGGWVRVLGRNVARTPDARAMLTGAGGGKVALKLTKGGLWDAAFDIPADLATGRYDLAIWNGEGDIGTWRRAGPLEIRAAQPVPALVLDVRAFGALGDNAHDDGPAIAATMASLAARGGGTAYLPRGQYRVSDALVIPPRVTLKGEARDLVNLVWPDMETPPEALVSGYSDFAVEDLSIFASNHLHVISGGFPADKAGRDGANIALRRVTIRASAFKGRATSEDLAQRFKAGLKLASGSIETIRLAGTNLTVEDCDVLGSNRSLLLLRPRGALVRRSSLYNGRVGWYSITGASGVIFEDNRVIGADLEATGGGINVFESVASENVLVKNNHFERFFGGDREALTADGPWGFYAGAAVSSGPSTLFLTQPPTGPGSWSDWRGSGVFVLKGRGMGEFARVVSREGAIVRLDRVLPVEMDGSSLVTILPLQQHYLVIENTFVDASIAVQFYGTSFQHVAAGNVSIRTGGLRSWGFEYFHPQPSWYNQFLNNTVQAGISDAVPAGNFVPPTAISAWGGEPKGYKAPLSYGTVLRSNRLSGNARIEIRGFNRTLPGLSTALVEGNRVENADTGILIDAGARNVWLRNNTFGNVGTNVVDER